MYHQPSHFTMYAPTPQKYSPWPQGSVAGGAPGGGSNDPRSIPTPPISSQPRKKTRVSATLELNASYYSHGPALSEKRGASPQSAVSAAAVSPSKEDPRYGDYDGSYDQYTLSANGSDAGSYWYTDHRRDDQDRRTSSGGELSLLRHLSIPPPPVNTDWRPREKAHYSTYATKSYSRHSTEDFENSPYSDSGDSGAARARQHYHHSRRGQSAYPENSAEAGNRWSPRVPTVQLAPSSEASAVAARQAVTELFPELNETHYPADDSARPVAATPTAARPPFYSNPHYMSASSRERYSQAMVDPNLSTTYRQSGTRSPSQSDRPRGHYGVSSVTPEALYPMPKSPSAHCDSAYTYVSLHNSHHHHSHHHHHQQQDSNDFDDSDDNDDNYDETDEDDDMSIAQNILTYRGESSESPGGESPEPITPMGTKSSSPDVANSSSSTYPPRGQNIRPSVKKSTTSSSPRRARKAIPPASSVPASEKYDEADMQLVRLRQQGVSYKNIKTQLNLEEAESTLRGRFRTLTKPKNERLRKPIWAEADVSIPHHPHHCFEKASSN